MIDHVSIGVSDLKAATSFYKSVLAALDYELRDDRPRTAGFGRRGKPHSEFWLNARLGMPRIAEDTGSHVCLRAISIAAVDQFFATAISLGAQDDGAPRIRPGYGDDGNEAYAAFIRDLDGNRIEAVTFLVR